MWCSYARPLVDAVQDWLLFVCYPLFDVRCGNYVPLSVGSSDEEYVGSRSFQRTLLLVCFSSGFSLCLEERSTERAIMKKPKIKSIPYEEFNDNETFESLVQKLNENGVNIVVKSLDDLFDWGRSNSLWPLTFATSCCGIEFMAVCAARYDIARFGFEVTRNSPRHADVILVSGTIVKKMAPVLKRLYDQMADPKYVIAIGGCSISGGPFRKSYHVVMGVDEIIPVDVYVPGCPPRPEAFLYGMMQLQRIVKVENFFGTTNRKERDPFKKEYEERSEKILASQEEA